MTTEIATEEMTKEQIDAVNFVTMRHIEMVRNLLNKIVTMLLRRAEVHDQSKLIEPEVEWFAKYTKLLADCTYGSEEYKQFLDELQPALTHHYAKNRHHPEHFKSGINDMNLVDLIEMLCDWRAATTRHHDGNLKKSIENNMGRFGIDHQLGQILMNSMALVEEE